MGRIDGQTRGWNGGQRAGLDCEEAFNVGNKCAGPSKQVPPYVCVDGKTPDPPRATGHPCLCKVVEIEQTQCA